MRELKRFEEALESDDFLEFLRMRLAPMLDPLLEHAEQIAETTLSKCSEENLLSEFLTTNRDEVRQILIKNALRDMLKGAVVSLRDEKEKH